MTERRSFLRASATLATVGTIGLAGCPDGGNGGNGDGNGGDDTNDTDGGDDTNGTDGGADTNGTDGGDGGDVSDTADFVLGGNTAAWEGRSPDAISGEDNPTLSFEAGTEYTVAWENVDGAIHNFVLLDADENHLESSEDADTEGTVVEFTFTATEEMAEYYCEYHPTSMRGDVELGG